MEYLETENGIFTNDELTGKTAQEVYNEWLSNKNKPQQPTTEDRLALLEKAMDEMLLGGAL